ncbi:MAG: ABC transporter permease [Nanoarchaeota archaeon]|nr:ABC transporter permease [Nanoarchaeota archaeon]
MISKEVMKYSLENLKKKKMRSLLTIISIFIGIATIFIFVSFGLGLYSYINSFVTGTSADKIIIQPKGMSAPGLDAGFALTEKDLTAIERTSGVQAATGIYMKVVQVEYKNTNKYVFVGGFDPRSNLMEELSGLKIYSGRQLQSNEKGDVVLGYNYMTDNKIFPNGVSLNEEIKINGEKAKVIGFYQPVGNPQDDSNVYMTDDFFRELYPNSTGYSEIIASVDTSNIPQVVQNVEKSLLKSRNLAKGQEDFFVASFEDLLKTYASALDIVVGFIILIALISVLVSAINTSNTMITSVIERTREIGVLKSIGARNSEIFTLFLFESSALGMIAGTIGVLIGFALTELAKAILMNLGLGFLQPNYSFWLFAGCILFATMTGAVSGVIPAIHASKISPVRALRYE